MFERYTERARRVLFFARYDASQLGSVQIDTEHLLLGLVREGRGLTFRLFDEFGVVVEKLRAEAEAHAVFVQKLPTSHEIPFSSEAKRALQYAAEEADRLEHAYIGTEHLLLGLLRDETVTAGAILTAHGLTLNGVREATVRLLATNEDFSKRRPASAAEVTALIERIKTQVTKLAELASRVEGPPTEARLLAVDIHLALDRLSSPWS